MKCKRKAYSVIIGLYSFIVISVFGQDQKIADSLARIYKSNKLPDTVKLELLRNLSFNELRDFNLSLQYAEELINLSSRLGNNLYLYRGYLQKGNKKRLMGDLDEALDAYFKSLEAARKAHYVKGEGAVYVAIGDVYGVSNNHQNAMLYYRKAIATLRQSNVTKEDSLLLATAITNAGDEFLNNKIFDSALIYFNESGQISGNLKNETGKAYNLGNIGMVYASIGDKILAEKNINEAIRMLKELEDYYPICVYLISMADIYMGRGEQGAALDYAQRSLQLAKQYELKEQISAAYLKISELYEKEGNIAESFKYFKDHIAYRDSVNNIKSVQKMADLRTDFEVSQMQTKVDLANQESKNQRNTILSLGAILGLITLLLGTLLRYYKSISKEKKISESLLLNILPVETAKELKQNGKVHSIKFDQVTVLFTDFIEFSKLAEKVDPEQLVRSIDFYFTKFDEITTKHGLEKIKTVGDAYMCACGLPTPTKTHARNIINAARDMIEVVNKERNAADGLSHFDVRVGVHTGPVVAGIVGIKKWQYDIWGDTVNIASRMESMSKPGRINMSETTYNEIKDEFSCEYRGEIEVKNRGVLKMYFLS